MSIFFHQLNCGDNLHRCIIEDNGSVAYAYLIREKRIVGDIWLYNQATTPENPEWQDRSKMPFLNPKAYVDFDSMQPPLCSTDEVDAKWEFDEGGLFVRVGLYLRGKLYGLLVPMAKPGWCVAARKDGPLAKPLPTMPTAG